MKDVSGKTLGKEIPILLLRHRHLVQDTGQGCYGYSIIGHRHTTGTHPPQTVQHMATRKHAGPAMDDQIVSGQVFGKVVSGHDVDVQSLAELTAQQTRKLHAPYIFMLRHVGAIRDGGDDKTDNVVGKRSAVQHKAVQRLSNRLRKGCTCGRINRPLGA